MPNDAPPTGDLSARFAQAAAAHPDRVAVRFLHGEPAVVEWTYAELKARADRVAAALAGQPAGERVLLLLPSGPELVTALLGCLRAGLVAVPAPMSASGRTARYGARIAALAADCTPAVAVVRTAADLPPGLLPDGMGTLALDALPADGAPPDVELGPSTLAYLQYSSGSTGTPKAVRNTHGALLHQVELFSALWPDPEPPHLVGWLPLYHDMGMILQLLTPLTTGGTTTFMAPASFAADPARWLRAVSEYRGQWLAAPDFAYVRVCEAVPAGEVAALDLSCVRYAMNGAEPIRPRTMARFADHFAAAGLDRSALSPGYGLAEAGLCVSVTPRPDTWVTRTYDADALTAGTAVPAGTGRQLVGCGSYFHEWDVRIVDPERREALGERTVGEIWVAGAGLPDGYWNRPAETEATFRATLAGGEGPWLRTGDLGFLDGGELFVCGRLKDLLIVHGANHHPNDVERTVELAVDGIGVGGVCAAQRTDGSVLVLAEVDRHLAPGTLAATAAAVRDAVLAAHEITVDEVALVRRSALPKTTSGKIRRGTAAAAYDAGELEALHADAVSTGEGSAAPGAVPAGELLGVLHESLCELLGREAVPPDGGFAGLGLDSLG
ncbi:MAG TPA: fatty acyl-AMP ligase, partial [Pseudonocardiaceae bacterium]